MSDGYWAYVNNNPLGSVDPNGADGQGKAGDKVVSVFLDLTTELGTQVTRYTNPTEVVIRPNVSDWGAAKSSSPSGYSLEVFGDPVYTGQAGPPSPVSHSAFENALEKSDAVVYIGHGVQANPGEPLTIPFQQAGIKVGFYEYTSTGTGSPYMDTGPFTGPKPTVTASVVANFSCDSDRTGGSYFNFAGTNQCMVTVDSGSDGITNASTLERAAYAFSKTYASSGGNVQKAVNAANKVLAKDPGSNQENKGDRIVLRRVT